tara:strand:+ start:896 stop:1063 length:168 start_codon:yes stop_codon:yes gene_type:complete
MNYLTDEMINVSLNQEGDKYNNKGQNVTAQERRQNLVKWTTVIYKKSKNRHKPQY